MTPSSFPLMSHARLAILDAVRAQPGISKSEVAFCTGLAWSTVHENLKRLEASGHVRVFRFGRRVRLVADEQETALAYAHAILERPGEGGLIRALASGRSVRPAAACREFRVPIRRIGTILATLMQLGLVISDGSYHPAFHATERMLRHLGARTPDAGSDPARF